MHRAVFCTCLLSLTLALLCDVTESRPPNDFSFSLPGRWGSTAAKRFKFSLPGKWGSETGKRMQDDDDKRAWSNNDYYDWADSLLPKSKQE